MEPIRTVIVDDEPLARENLRLRLQVLPDFDVAAECSGGQDALDAVANHEPELLFIDVQMPDLDGFEVVERIPVRLQPVIVFVTAYDRYALEAFRVHALDYLLKPFSDERFDDAWKHAREQVLARRQAPGATLQAGRDRLLIKSPGKISLLPVDDIDWVEANGDYARVHAGGRSYLLRRTMVEMEARLGGSGFMRISRSVIVNLDRVKELSPLKRGEYQVALCDGQEVKLTRSYRAQLESLVGDLL